MEMTEFCLIQLFVLLIIMEKNQTFFIEIVKELSIRECLVLCQFSLEAVQQHIRFILSF